MILLDFLLAFPLQLLLLMSMAVMLLAAGRWYVFLLADWELQQEISSSMQRIVRDAESGSILKAVSPEGSGGLRIIYKRENNGVLREEKVWYWVHEKDRLHKLVRNQNTAPMTGEHALAGVDITSFSCRKVKPGLLRIGLEGKSRVTGHRYGLTTAVYVPEVP